MSCISLYAPGGRFYNTQWGYFVIATSHYDNYEKCGGWSGQSEKAEKQICTDAMYALGPRGDCWYDGGPVMANATANENVNGHWWMNDGETSEALVP